MAFSAADHLGAVDRRLSTVERDGREVKRLTITRTYPAGVADVWDALTDAERIPRWFLPISGELEVGGRFQLQDNAGGRILECQSPRHLAITWEYGDQISWVEVSLEEIGAGTRLRLEHDSPVDPEQWAEFGPGAVGIGWELGLMGLAHHFTIDEARDPATTAAWMVGPDGVAFMTGSSNAWGEAAIADGDDPVAARAAAERCADAYIGPPTEPVDTTSAKSPDQR